MKLRLVLPLLALFAACSSPKATTEETVTDVVADAAVEVADDVTTVTDVAGTDAATTDTGGFVPGQACIDGGWSAQAFATGPFGTHRHDLADDFTLPLADGTDWHFAERWIGCENYLFVPDILTISDLNTASIWTKDLNNLVKLSPKNVHYFFVSLQSAANAQTSIDAMQGRVDALVNNMPEADGAFWRDHLHVVAKRAQELTEWPHDVLLSHGQIGFGIDRTQRIRGFGMLADVTRQKQALQDAGKWPWEANLAYAANEAVMYNGEALRADVRVGEQAYVVPAWQGEVISQFAEMDVTLTTADKLADYDTLEVDIDMRCPDPEKPEPGNCGAWDYIASLAVRDADGKNVEMARFITSYHRETHWTVDATPFLVYLRKGGVQHIRWEWAPEWNVQPTSTYLSLRFSNRKKGYQPKTLTKLWDGGGFNSQYDGLHPDKAAPVPSSTKKSELWALITGHGSDTGTQCAEFCNHQHVFSVGGKTFTKEHKEAGSSNKCMPNMSKGMTPNQGGTWWFGRGGWCPGMQVDPWVVDLAGAITNTTPSFSYHGQLANKTPPDGGANIDGAVWLVTYE